MKKNELNKLREKSIKQLKDMVDKNKLELLKTKTKVMAGKEKNLKKVKNLKKEIAQTLTVIREKELIEDQEQRTKNKGQRKEKL